jgi:hypothetical protein
VPGKKTDQGKAEVLAFVADNRTVQINNFPAYFNWPPNRSVGPPRRGNLKEGNSNPVEGIHFNGAVWLAGRVLLRTVPVQFQAVLIRVVQVSAIVQIIFLKRILVLRG